MTSPCWRPLGLVRAGTSAAMPPGRAEDEAMPTIDHAPPWSWTAAGRAAARDLLPSLIALVPFALVVGVTAQRTGAGIAGGVGAGFAIYAGTAQLSALSLLHEGAPAATVVLAVAVINARLPLYAAALESHFRGQPRWFRWFGPHFIVDQTFAIVTARDDLDDPVRFRRYWLATAGVLTLVWLTVIATGMSLGDRLPASHPALVFTPIALFVPMLVPRLANRPAAVAAGVSALTAAAAQLSGLMSSGLPILVGALTGTVAAAAAAKRGTS